MTATVNLSPLPKQRFTDANGNPLSGGKVFTYAAGTTTKQNSYTDSTGATPNANPVILDSRGEAAIWLDQNLAYKVTLAPANDTDPPGAPIWTIDNIPIGLSGSSGSSLVGFLQSGTGAVARTAQSKLRDVVNVADFGGAFDGVTDDSAVVQKAITAVALAGGGNVSFPYGKSVSIANTVHIPAGIKLNLNGCTITGAGIGVGTVFDTGYISGAAVITNIGTPADSHRVIEAEIYGGTIQNCQYAFNLYNFNEHSQLHDIEFSNCTWAVNSSRPWYSSYRRLMSRNSASGATNAAYSFDSFVNVVEIEQVNAINRALGFKFSLGCYGLTLRNCSAESCTAGMLFTDTVHSLTMRGNYFENITARALEFSGASSSFVSMDIDANWFNQCATAVYAINFNGRWGRQNRRNTGNCTVDFSDASSSVIFEQQRGYTATNIAAPGLEANVVALGGRSIAVGDDTLYNSGTGLPTVRSNNFGAAKVPLTMWGDPGQPDSGVIPFSTNVSSAPGATPFSVLVNTKITSQVAGMVAYNITVSDNTGSYQLAGIVFGTTVFKLDATAKTVTAAIVQGLLQLTLGAGNQFSHPTGVYTATGTVRII